MTFSAVLLAGGESRRMGKEKATVLFRGQPLWQHAFNVLRELQPEKIFVSARSGRDWRPAEAELLLDSSPSRGPLSGICGALVRMETSHLIALAVDMPFMTASQVRELCSKATPGGGVVPVVSRQIEPLAAIYPIEAREKLAAALDGNDWSMQSVVRQLIDLGIVSLFPVAQEQAALFRSLNAPNDL